MEAVMSMEDILEIIFQSAVTDWEETQAFYYDRNWADLFDLLCALLLVNRLWHDVVLGQPLLWRNVRVLGDTHHGDRLPQYFPAATCISRSGIVPLNIFIYGNVYPHTVFGCSASSCCNPQHTTVCNRLIPRFSTLKNLRMDALNGDLYAPAFTKLLASMPSLERLELSYLMAVSVREMDTWTPVTLTSLRVLSIHDAESEYLETVLSFLVCPLLTHLKLRSDDIEGGEPIFGYKDCGPLPSVKIITLAGSLPYHDTFKILERVPNAVILRLVDFHHPFIESATSRFDFYGFIHTLFNERIYSNIEYIAFRGLVAPEVRVVLGIGRSGEYSTDKGTFERIMEVHSSMPS